MIWPLFITTVMPRAMPMIRATPSRSRAPSTKEPVRFSSDSPPIRPMMMLKSRNDAVISGNHHHSVGNGTLRSSHGMTPYIITQEGEPEHDQDHLLAAGQVGRRPRRP